MNFCSIAKRLRLEPHLFAAILVCLGWVGIPPHPVMAQTCCGILDSLFVPALDGIPGSAGFELGEPELPDDRFDATGDGLPDLISVERNENGSPSRFVVLDVNTASEYVAVMTHPYFQQLLNEGWQESELRGIRFIGFFDWLPEGSQFPKAALFISSGGPIIFDLNTERAIHSPPSSSRIMWLGDLFDNGIVEIGIALNGTIYILKSKFTEGG